MLDFLTAEKRMQKNIERESRQRKIVDCIQRYSIDKRISSEDLKNNDTRKKYKKSGYVFVSQKDPMNEKQNSEFITDDEIVQAYEAIVMNGVPNLDSKTYDVQIGGIKQQVDKEKIDLFRALYDKRQAKNTRRTVRLWSSS
ncbi:MAG: hypothetical protein AAB492_04565 [Patescibacteria group bacterium]